LRKRSSYEATSVFKNNGYDYSGGGMECKQVIIIGKESFKLTD